MTPTAIAAGARSRATVSAVAPRQPERFPRYGVVGEVKPHNPTGIQGGIAQLRRRLGLTAHGRATPGRPAGPHRTPQLVTYRPVPRDPALFDVLIADPTQLRAALTRPGTAPTSWYPVGRLSFPAALRPIPLGSCPTLLGLEIEGDVRALYARWLHERLGHPPLHLDPRSARARGADIEHELAEFLTELGTVLGREPAHS